MDNSFFVDTGAQLTLCSQMLINGFSLAPNWFPVNWDYWHQLIPSSAISQQGDTEEVIPPICAPVY